MPRKSKVKNQKDIVLLEEEKEKHQKEFKNYYQI